MDSEGGRPLVYGPFLSNEDEEEENLEESGDSNEPEVAELLGYQVNFQHIVQAKAAPSTKINYLGHIKRFCVWLAKYVYTFGFCLNLAVQPTKATAELYWQRLNFSQLTALAVKTYLGFYLYRRDKTLKSRKVFEGFCLLSDWLWIP